MFTDFHNFFSIFICILFRQINFRNSKSCFLCCILKFQIFQVYSGVKLPRYTYTLTKSPTPSSSPTPNLHIPMSFWRWFIHIQSFCFNKQSFVVKELLAISRDHNPGLKYVELCCRHSIKIKYYFSLRIFWKIGLCDPWQSRLDNLIFSFLSCQRGWVSSRNLPRLFLESTSLS